MSTPNAHQQSLVDAIFETRPPMFERGSYIPWRSRFRRYINRKRETRKWLNKAIDEGPYEFKVFTPSETEAPRMQKEEDLRGDDLKHYEAEIEWLKYVTQIRLAKILTKDSYDDLFDYLQQFEKLVNASRAKKLVKSHDPLALVAHTGSSSRTSSAYYVTHPSSMVDYDDDYQGDTVQKNSDDPLTSAMILLARAINRNLIGCFHTYRVFPGRLSPTRLEWKIDTIEDLSLKEGIDLRSEKGHYARNFLKPRIRDSKYFMEQMLLAKQDEAEVILTDEQNDFLFADALRMEETKELSANICLMAKIQPANIDSDVGPSYDSAFLSEVQTPSTSYVNPLFAKDNQEQKYLTKPKIINKSIGDDQIDSNIIFDEPNEDVNSGNVENDNNVQDSYDIEQLARNAYKEAEKQQIIAKKVQQQNIMLTKQLELYKEKIRLFEITKEKTNNYFNEHIKAIRKAKRFE
ncbi:hypothetical protein Tco_0410439 [Tanacetum coccineum]